MRVSAVIFDMDGLMVDTEPVYQAAWQPRRSGCDGPEIGPLCWIELSSCVLLAVDEAGVD